MWVKSLCFVLIFLNTFLLSFCSIMIPSISLGLALNSPTCGYWSNLRSKSQNWLVGGSVQNRKHSRRSQNSDGEVSGIGGVLTLGWPSRSWKSLITTPASRGGFQGALRGFSKGGCNVWSDGKTVGCNILHLEENIAWPINQFIV